MISALLRSMRPKQWSKNLLVFAGYLFTIEKSPSGDFWRVLLAFALFCMISGAVYIMNDVMDIEKDRHHPVKCKRPLASGQVSIGTALTFALFLAAVAFIAGFRLNLYFGLSIVAYLLLNFAYTFRFKHVVILDLLILAGGFVIRAVAGAVAINVVISPWLLLCTTLLALFLGLAKRRHEIIILEGDAVNHRKILNEYSVMYLDQMIIITSSTALMAYSLYTFSGFSDTATSHPYMMVTIPFVIYGIFRYLYLIHTKNAGGRPEQVLLDDKPLLINIVLWAAVVATILKWSDVVNLVQRFF
ncbi:MAG: decaprenyl-phosphate phosphoribosyltransferase [Armatimonadota bacterium]